MRTLLHSDRRLVDDELLQPCITERRVNLVSSATLRQRLRKFGRFALASGLGLRPVGPFTRDLTFAPPRIAILRYDADIAELRRIFSTSPKEAVRAIKAAADNGFPAAQTVWGQVLLDGKLVPRDPEGAFRAFAMAADQGDVDALNMVGRCYEQGWGVAADAGRATSKFEMAAERGHLWAQVNLAQMLMRAGAPQDRPRCFALFKAAAEGGSSKANIKAMNSLARFLEEGWAGTSDLDGAAFWYLRAADAGDHWAQFNLGTIVFQQGDHVAADKCFRSAIAAGDNGFRRRVAGLLLNRPELELRLHGIEALRRCAETGALEDQNAYASSLDAGFTGPRDLDEGGAHLKTVIAAVPTTVTTTFKKTMMRR